MIDIGVNLTSASFAHDRADVIARAGAAGVDTLVVTGGTVDGSREAATLAEAPPPVADATTPAPAADATTSAPSALFATAGVHPHHAAEVTGDWIGALRALAARPRVVAVGECGLDFNRNLSPRAAQLAAFEAQLALAAELRLPVFLHERDAHADFVAILRAHRPALVAAVIHCFTGTRAELDAYLALDLHVGITGWICDERRGLHLRDLVAAIPGERLMIETDAPYLLPRDLPTPPKDRRNEPAFLPQVLAAVARARREDPAHTEVTTTATARAFFAKMAGATR